MRKLKLLLAVCALLFGVTAMQAATDVTSTYLRNADLSTDPSSADNGWSLKNNWRQDYQKATDDTHVNVLEFYAGWGGLEKTEYAMSQAITLPAGYYRIAVNAFFRQGNDGNGTNNNKAWIFAGEKKQNVVGIKQSDLGSYSGSSDLWKASNAFYLGKFSNEFDFHLAEEQTINVGFEGIFDEARCWVILGPVKILEYTKDDYIQDYKDKVEIATPLLEKKMNAAVLQALQNAIVDESTLNTVDDVQNAVSTIIGAINDANTSIGSYEQLKSAIDAFDANYEKFDSYGKAAADEAGAPATKAAYTNGTATDGATEITALKAAFRAGVLATKQPGDGLDMTAYVTNPDFNSGNTDGWTKETPYGGNCAIQGGSRMEYWAGNASDRAKASFNIYQEITNLPAGVYTISADMYNSLNDEGGSYTEFSPTCGVYGSSSNEEVALVTEEGTTLKTYTTGEVLVFKGHLTLGTKNTVTPMAARWFLFDNVKLTYARQFTNEEIAANIVPESISLNKTNADLTIYGTETLEATILPENAVDKTITWTSSDETVATVTNGVITAVGLGSATITASANGADDVTATATVTVSDVTPVAAPSFYSEIAAGDFYIVNAATGKFISGANNWGTQASLIEHGLLFTAALNDGKYTLDSHTYESDTKHFLTGTYVDGVSTPLYIVSKGDGKYSISTADGSQFLTAKPGTTVVDNSAANANSTLTQWYFLSKADRDKMLAAATAEKPADATYYIKEANFSRNWGTTGKNVSAWTGAHTKGGDNSNMNSMVQNAAADVYQTIEGLPNGTYTVKVQAISTGTAIFYANAQEVEITACPDDITTQTIASNAFGGGFFWNTLNVTVTDRTLKIGVKSDDTDKVLYFDNFELLMTGYTANTGVTATIDNAEFEAGQTAQITAATNPANASFNAITYTSSDEDIATVDASGLVTGKSIGVATITVKAEEMENFSKTIDVTVTAVSPTALTMKDGEDDVTDPIALDEDNTSVVLSVVASPDGANATVNWESSDKTVAIVEDGVVTAVSTGTATITATSTLDANVSASATINVSFTETNVVTSTYVNSGATRTIATLGDNLIKNGSFEYPNNFYGWTTGSGVAMSADNFKLITEDENHYITAKGHTGAGGDNSVGTGWAIDAGKTYVFGYKVKSTSAGNSEFHVVSLTDELGTETTKISETSTAVGTEWTDVKYTFTNPNTDGYAYVQFRARWLNSAVSFDDFYLCEATTTTVGNVDYATAAIPTANIGTGAFQYSQDAINAANALVQGTATVEDVQNAYNAITTLNAPDADKLYNIINISEGYNHTGKAVTFKSASDADLTGNTTAMGYTELPGSTYPQGVKFTATGEPNTYILSYTRADGNTVYVGTGSSTGLGSNNDQIRPTTDADKAVAIKVFATATEGVWNLYNTLANKNIGANGANDQGFYTTNQFNSMKIQEAVANEVALNIDKKNQYGTLIVPFDAAIPSGVVAYSCGNVDGTTLELSTEETSFKANTPYIVFAEAGITETLSGIGAAYTDATYTAGLLTGIYADTQVPVGSYILQNQNDVVAFYNVVDGYQPTLKANHAYLTVPAPTREALYFGGDATGIMAIDALTSGDATIFNAAGAQIPALQKGMNIVRKANGKSYKVIVK